MRIYEVDLTGVSDAVNKVSHNLYHDNVIIRDWKYLSKNCLQFTLRVKSSKEPGHRTSYSGRRIPSACWHVHRDVFRAIFDRFPEARIVSAHADYRGGKRFLREIPSYWLE